MRHLVGWFAALTLATGPAAALAADADYAVGPQYDTTHVYVAPGDYDTFMKSFSATFGGTLGPEIQLQVTPTPSRTKSQLAFTPSGNISTFGFLTPIPYPFGGERNGYLVSDINAATASAVRHGAIRLISIFPDKFGHDTVVQWPGGVNMQLYSHNAKPSYAPLKRSPENRIYLTPDAVGPFLASWGGYAHARTLRDDAHADGAEIGQPGAQVRRVQLTSGYGDMVVFVSNGQLPWPYGAETTGYAVADLSATLERAHAAGVEIVVAPHTVGDRRSAMVRFPGGYVAEVHAKYTR